MINDQLVTQAGGRVDAFGNIEDIPTSNAVFGGPEGAPYYRTHRVLDFERQCAVGRSGFSKFYLNLAYGTPGEEKLLPSTRRVFEVVAVIMVEHFFIDVTDINRRFVGEGSRRARGRRADRSCYRYRSCRHDGRRIRIVIDVIGVVAPVGPDGVESILRRIIDHTERMVMISQVGFIVGYLDGRTPACSR